MLRWPGVNCTLRASFGITNCLCMRVLAYRMTYRGVLSRQKRWNKGGHRDWKFLFLFLLSSTFIFLFFLSHLVTWGEMDRNWQHTCCCWQPSHCSCSLDVKGGKKKMKEAQLFSKYYTCKDNMFASVETDPFFCRKYFPLPTAVQETGEMFFCLSLSFSSLAQRKRGLIPFLLFCWGGFQTSH